MLLPKKLSLSMMQDKWASILNLFIQNPSLNSVLLQNVSLIGGTNTINHTLGRVLQGWRIVGINGIAAVYDAQASNQSPSLTLVLVSNAAVMVNLEVF